MSERSISISWRIDSGVVEHNNRNFVAKNVVRERIPDNITYVKQDIREKYNELFGAALEEYNAKQKRKDRKITDYYEHIKNSKQEKPFYELVVQFGDKDDCGFGKENFEDAKEMLAEYIRDFEKRNPNMKVFNAVMHLDEATPHLHIDFIPICKSETTRGLSTRVSLKGALREQGINSESKKVSEWAAWGKTEKKFLAEILRRHNFIRRAKGANYAHMTVDEYKSARREIDKINAHINELKKKNPAELTPDETELIKNQNDFLRSEIQKRDEKIRALSAKVGARFVPFEVYSEEKISFITEELSRINLPFIEESSAVYVPEYALKTCAAIAAKYIPQRSPGIHDAIKMDIDRLVYSCENLTELLKRLREMGYEIKEGKYLAVKPKQAQRFVRIKSLGTKYLPQNIEKRIAEKEKFPMAVKKKSETARGAERFFYAAVVQTIVAVRELRYTPRKSNPKRIYCFENDRDINFLAEQLLTMSEMKLNSREKIYDTADELQQKNSEKREQINKLYAEIPTLKTRIAAIKNSENPDKEELRNLERRLRLIPTYAGALKSETSDLQLKAKRVSDVIRAYEAIEDGNFIDNMIKAEREQTERENSENISRGKNTDKTI